MGILYTIQPEDREPIDFTHFDCWEDDDTWESVAEAWSRTLKVKLPTDNADSTIMAILKSGFDVYEGDQFIEIYESQEDL